MAHVSFAAMLKQRHDIRHVFVVAQKDCSFKRDTNLRWRIVREFDNGGLPVDLLMLVRK